MGVNLPEAIPHRPDSDQFDLRASFQKIVGACRARKWLVILTCAATVGLAVGYMHYWPPIYKAEVLLAADSPKDLSRDAFYNTWDVFRNEDPQSDAELLLARPVLKNVVRDLHLKYDDVYHTFLDHTSYLWQESWPGKNYRSVKEYFFPPVKLAFAPTKEEADQARTVAALRSGIAVQSAGEAHVGTLVVKGPTPQVAQIANRLIDEYLLQRRQRQIDEATTACQALQVEVDQAQKKVLACEEQMKQYYEDNGMLLDFEKDKVEIAQWMNLKGAIMEIQSTIAGIEKNRDEVARQLEKEPPEVVGARVEEQNPLRERMKTRRFELDSALTQLLERYQPDAPEVVEVRNQIASLEKMINAEPVTVEASRSLQLNKVSEELRQRRDQLEAELAGARAGLAVRTHDAEALGQHIAGVPEKMKMMRQLGRERDALEKAFVLLQEKLQTAAVSMATARSAPPSLHVISYASAPDKPGWPNAKILISAALALGLLGGIGLATLMEALRGRVRPGQLAGTDFALYATLQLDRKRARILTGAPCLKAAGGNGGAQQSLGVKERSP